MIKNCSITLCVAFGIALFSQKVLAFDDEGSRNNDGFFDTTDDSFRREYTKALEKFSALFGRVHAAEDFNEEVIQRTRKEAQFVQAEDSVESSSSDYSHNVLPTETVEPKLSEEVSVADAKESNEQPVRLVDHSTTQEELILDAEFRELEPASEVQPVGEQHSNSVTGLVKNDASIITSGQAAIVALYAAVTCVVVYAVYRTVRANCKNVRVSNASCGKQLKKKASPSRVEIASS